MDIAGTGEGAAKRDIWRGAKSSLLLAVVLLLAVSQARADWTAGGVAYRCDPLKRSFTIVSTMETSSPDDPGTVKMPRGFTELTRSRTVDCKVGRVKVTVKFTIGRPTLRGTGGEITHYLLDYVRVNGNGVLLEPSHVNAGGDAVHSLEIREVGKAIRMKVCRAEWDWGVGYHDVQCEEHDLEA